MPTHSVDQLVEELRSTGYFGRDQWLSAIDPAKGTAIAAIRQLEVCASQIVLPWIEGNLEDRELWDFFRLSFEPRLDSLEKIVDRSALSLNGSGDARAEHSIFLDAWTNTRRLIDCLRTTNDDGCGYGHLVVSLLVSCMILRQAAESVLSQRFDSEGFKGESTNVAGEFLNRCFDKLKWKPFQLSTLSTVKDLSAEVAVANWLTTCAIVQTTQSPDELSTPEQTNAEGSRGRRTIGAAKRASLKERASIEIETALVAAEIIRSDPQRRVRFDRIVSGLNMQLTTLCKLITNEHDRMRDRWLHHWVFADEEFHLWLARFSSRRNAEERLGDIIKRHGSPFNASTRITYNDMQAVIDEHQSICDAILRGQAGQINRTIRHHLEMSHKRFKSRLLE